MTSSRAAQPLLRGKIAAKAREEDEADHYDRTLYSPQILNAARLIEWVGSRHLDFTAADLCEELGCCPSVSLRWLRSVELIDWVKVVIDGGQGRRAVFRSRVRIRRVG